MVVDLPEGPVECAAIKLSVFAVDLYHLKQLAKVFLLANMFEFARARLTERTDFSSFNPMLNAALTEDSDLASITKLWVLKQTEVLTDYASEHVFDRLYISKLTYSSTIFLLHLSNSCLRFFSFPNFFKSQILFRSQQMGRPSVLLDHLNHLIAGRGGPKRCRLFVIAVQSLVITHIL